MSAVGPDEDNFEVFSFQNLQYYVRKYNHLLSFSTTVFSTPLPNTTTSSTEVITTPTATPEPNGEPGRVFVGVASVIVDEETLSDLTDGQTRDSSPNLNRLEGEFQRYVSNY